MIVTIVTLIALLFVMVIVFGIRSLYLLSSSHKHTMQSDMKTKALDVFLYLGIAISLIVSITNFLQVIFAAVDRKFVDILQATAYVDSTASDVRFAIASLVVMFPIYVALSWYVSRDIAKFLYKQDIFIRKVMIYCTLFITVLTLIGTLVSVIYNYLGGDLSVSFGLKAVSVFVVALALFTYYYYSLRRDYSKTTSVPTVIAVFVSLLITALVTWSVSIIGGPSTMRAMKIDNVRLSDISGIQSQIVNRVQMTDKLPVALSELTNMIQEYQAPVDPITKESYVYRVIQQPVIKTSYGTNKKEMTTEAIFELCATFDTVRSVDARGQSIPMIDKGGVLSESFYSANNYYYTGDISPFWNHGIGETCFKRIISPDMYYGR